jgi:5'-nucleotidase
MGRVRVWAAPLALAAIAIGVVLAAPLASPNEATAGPIISGARSLSDQINVSFAAVPPGHSTVDVHLLAFNDLHGTLDPGSQTLYGQFAGGAAYLAKAVKDKQGAYGANQATVLAGDNIGASPLASALFHDEPITIASNLMHVDLASVGNHEFDEGSAELLRVQNGGCHPTDGCAAAPYKLANGGTTDVYPGADFQYLSTNVVVNATGKTLFPETAIKQFSSTDGKRKIKVGFIGETLEGTPTIVTPSGVAGLTFQDEADAANRAVAALADRGVKVPILVIHQGGFQSSAPTAVNGCAGNLAGSDIAEIASRLDPAIKVIVSAHTHAEYRCTITTGGVTRLITSASSFGRVLSDLTLTIDENNDRLVSADATNILIRNATNTPAPGVTRSPDPTLADEQVQAVVSQYVAAAAPLANRVVGSITETLLSTRDSGGDPDADGEAPLGNIIADSQLDASAPPQFGSAVIAFMNPGGIRRPILYDQISGGEQPGEVTYGELFDVQPFGNTLVVKTCTGAQIQALLEQQQFPTVPGSPQRVLTVSRGFNYTWDANLASGSKVINSTVTLNGAPIVDSQSYRVEMNNFLASGGDGFTVFAQCTDQLGGEVDLDAIVRYFGAHSPVSPPTENRITRLN